MKKKTIIIIAAVVLAALLGAAILPAALSAARVGREMKLGERYLSELDYESAALCYSRVLEIDPKHKDAALGFAAAKNAAGNPAAAAEILASLGGGMSKAKLAKIETEIEDQIRRCLEDGSDRSLTAARDLLRLLTRLHPKDASVWERLAACYRDMGRDRLAVRTLKEGIAATRDEGLKAQLSDTAVSDVRSISAERDGQMKIFTSIPYDPTVPLDFSADYAVVWKDPQFEAMVRVWLDRPTGDIMRSELDGITDVHIIGGDKLYLNWTDRQNGTPYERIGYSCKSRGAILTFQDLMQFRDLRKVLVCSCEIPDFSLLKRLEGLQTLVFVDLEVDYDTVSVMRQLRSLGLNDVGLDDIGKITKLVNLVSLDLEDNDLTDISKLSNFKQLERLAISENPIEDFSVLRRMTGLDTLKLGGTGISDISVLGGMYRLNTLYLYKNNITDITPLAGLTGLWTLDLGQNPLGDLTPIANLPELFTLWIDGCPGIDTAPVAHVPDLCTSVAPYDNHRNTHQY